MSFDPKYSVREPNIEDATNLIGALLRSAGADTLKDMLAGMTSADNDADRNRQASEGFVMLILDALSNPGTRDDLLFILGDVWQYEPGNVDEVPDFFEYEPTPDAVRRGQAVSRDERWRALSRRNRKRLIKRHEIGQLPLPALIEFVQAFKETVDFSAFLGSLSTLAPGKAGSSTTPSPDDTAGTTDK